MPFEENEISKNAWGGTEITKRTLGRLVPEELQREAQIIASRVRDLDEKKIRIFWANDLPEDPEAQKFRDENFRNKFHSIVFTSHWLQQRYQLVQNIPYKKDYQVIETAVEPIVTNDAKWQLNDKVRLVYTSTPNRGLQILLPVFEKLQEKYGDKIHLDVFSSFKIYGWDETDKQFQPLYDICDKNPGITYHGFQPHEAVTKFLSEQAHILAYPCIWQETSCRAVIEAMSAKLLCVHPNLAALPETSGSQNMMYVGDQDFQTHANVFIGALDQALTLVLNKDPYLQNKLNFNKVFVDNRFGAPRIAAAWAALLTMLKEQYPTVETRKYAKELFVYKQ